MPKLKPIYPLPAALRHTGYIASYNEITVDPGGTILLRLGGLGEQFQIAISEGDLDVWTARRYTAEDVSPLRNGETRADVAKRPRHERLIYASCRLQGRKEFAHRLLLDAPKGLHVDHIDGDTLNYRRENLRLVSRQRNAQNRHRPNANSSSGVLGVHPFPNKTNPTHWRAFWREDGEQRYAFFRYTDQGKRDAIAHRAERCAALYDRDDPAPRLEAVA